MKDNAPTTSDKVTLSPAEQADHERSVHDYPDIQFSPTEYVVIDVARSIWGLVRIWLYSLLLFVAMAIILLLVDRTSPTQLNGLAEFGLLLATVVIPMMAGLVGSWIYRRNRFIVTNERIYSHIQYSPFAKRSQMIEIEHIEDCSYLQTNIMQIILNYGSIRLSTVGDEQTYIFTFVDHPKIQFRSVNRVVQQVDEGEPTKYRYRK